ncbi:MAG: CaiB/BaiF CoA transferase family protein [Dehalococcoidia bacterium]
MTEALQGVTVLDIAEGLAGPFAARLLADLGADVIKIEPPGGDASRRLGPFPSSSLNDSECSGLFLYANMSKRGIVLDLGDEHDRDSFRGLVKAADILIESFPPGHLDQLGLGYPELHGLNPGLIAVSVTPFGQTGPYRLWQSEEIVEWAMGGYMYFGGDPAKAPLMIPGYQAQFHAAQEAAVATLAALHYRERGGSGQQIDLSIVEAVLSAHSWTSAAWSHGGQVLQRSGSDLMRCKDGWVHFMRRRFEPDLFLLIEHPELQDEPRFADPLLWMDPSSEIWQLVAAWCRDQEAQAIYHAAQALRIPVTPVNTMHDLLNSPQLQERSWLLEVEHPRAGRLTYPGFPYKLSATPARVYRAAPLLGQDIDQVLRETGVVGSPSVSTEGRRHSEADTAPAPTGEEEVTPLALAGVKVLEITANWAGPLAGRHLADLGAEVIKIEHAQRPATRGAWFAGNDPAKYFYNRAGYFNKLNRNKYDVCLDLSHPDGKALFLRLVERADIVIENNSARVMPNLGLGYDVLSAVNSRLIMISMSGFGATGPERDYVAYGANVEASSGLASTTGYGDGRPYRAGSFYADPITGTYGAVAALTALRAREQDGQGQFIDMALNECGVTFFGMALLEYQMTGVMPPQRGNRHPIFAPQGCYQTIGNDAWLVISIRDDGEWRALCRVIGRSDWAGEAELDGLEGRRRRHDELDRGLSDWTRGYDHREAARLLQSAGIAAAPVLANWELLSDPHFYARHFYIPIEQAETGVFPYPGMPWKLSRTPGRVRMAAPLFAEHNDYVFQQILGLTPAQVAELEAAGVTARSPAPGVVWPPSR